MSGLLGNLTSAAGALDAHRLGMEVAGQNLANINTPGYTRRMLLLAAIAPTSTPGAGRGVEVVGVQALRDGFAEARIRAEQSGLMYDTGVAESLAVLEGAIGLPGASLDRQLTTLFDRFAQLADDPTSPSARDAVVRAAADLAAGFRDVSGRIDAMRREADRTAVATVNEINAIAIQVATLNAHISGSPGPESDTLRDTRDTALARLAELGGVAVIGRPDGAVDVTIGSGRALVIGSDAYALTTSAAGPSGLHTISSADTEISAEIAGGRLGGLLHVRDAIAPAYSATIDQLAHDVATRINAVHATGFDGTGAPAGVVFVPPAAVAGAAAALAIDPALLADSQRLGASASGAAGNNEVARALADLRNTAFATGGTATAAEAWGQIVFRVGSDLESARSSATSRAQVTLQLQRLRDETSGVSVDEEAAQLMRFQRAYEASARYFTTISDTLDELMAMVRR